MQSITKKITEPKTPSNELFQLHNTIWSFFATKYKLKLTDNQITEIITLIKPSSLKD